MPIIAVVIVALIAFIGLIPLSMVMRFRTAAARRRARRWVATANLIAVAASAALVLLGAAITSRAVPDALTWTLVGLSVGCTLGLCGVALTRWEWVAGTLHYRPNLWLGLTVSLVVTGRVLYGFWRSWDAWRASVDQMAWVAASGLAASMSAGAVVLGYYLIYWAGVRDHMRQHGW